MSLIFAGSVVNLFLADTTQEYANYQSKNNNFVVELNKTYEDGNIKVQSGFNLVDYSEYSALYTGNNKFTAYKSTILDFPVKGEEDQDSNFYAETIQRVNLYQDIDDFKLINDYTYVTNEDYTCLITDYIADMLIYYGYFGNSVNTYQKLYGKKISHPYFKNKLQIIGIIETPNYFNFTKSFDFEKNTFRSKDIEVAFKDNLPFYNAIYMTETEFYSETTTSLLTYSKNVDTVIDNVIYEGLGKKGYTENVIFTDFDYSATYSGKAPVKPEDGEPIQLAVSRGFLNDLYGQGNYAMSAEGVPMYNNSSLSPGLINASGYMANFKITGIKRSQAVFNFIITAVVDTDEHIVYLPSYMYQAYLNNSFNRGGYLVMTINQDENINANIYRDMLTNNITINNSSFKKLQLVDDFINDNLFLFAAMFFVFCLFSVLMIFNFIIINIKNSTRDIGIYMSLGMNGFKIAMIYFFQVLVVSVISLIIGLIGSAVFLFVLDAIFSAQSPINFAIIKYTFLGVLAMAALAFITPTIAVLFPLLNLSRKKPIDVLKVA